MINRVVEVYAQKPNLRWACGSGFVLGDRLILTAAHVVCGEYGPLDLVQVRIGDSALLAAQVGWHGVEAGLDVALLEVTDGQWPSSLWPKPVRWGRLVTSSAVKAEATGFPEVVRTPERRDTHHLVGTISPGSLVKAKLYAVEVDNAPDRQTRGGSPWTGMSGAAVLCAKMLTAVVVTDPAGFSSRRLVALPVGEFVTQPGFSNLVLQHTGARPDVQPVELDALAVGVEAVDSPAALLRADVAPMRFRPRPELSELASWCRSQPAWSARLVCGPGGQGKTRLAHELALTMRAEGWASVMLSDTAADDAVAVLSDLRIPILVIVDYAEARPEQLVRVCDALRRAEVAARLLLLARTDGDWREEHADRFARLDFLATLTVVTLAPLEREPRGRQAAWQEAVTAFAARLGDLAGYESIDWHAVAAEIATPTLAEARYHVVLEIMFDALAGLLGKGLPAVASGAGDPVDVLLRHEARYWSRTAAQHAMALGASTRRCVVTYATLYGAHDAGAAERVLAAVPGVRDLREASRTAVAAWLASMYGDDGRYWSQLQPDRLAEHLLAKNLAPAAPCRHALEATLVNTADAQLDHALTLLSQAHVHQPGIAPTITALVSAGGLRACLAAIELVPRVEHQEPLIDALNSYVGTAELGQLTLLADRLPRYSVGLASTALSIADRITQLLRRSAADDRVTHLPALARSLHTLSYRLGEAERRSEALAAAREAVALSGELAAQDPMAHLLLLARSANNLAIRLGAEGRLSEAVAVAEEAVEHCRRLVARDRNTFLSDLGNAVFSLSDRLSGMGRLAEGLVFAQEAVDLRRELVERDPETYLEALAGSVTNLALRLGQGNYLQEGLAAAQEAVDLYQGLVARNRDAYLPDLASALRTLANRLGSLNRADDAVAIAQEALALHKELATRDPVTYEPGLAASLSVLAVMLDAVGRRAEALAAAEEAVVIHRVLVLRNRDAHLPDLANAIHNRAYDLHVAGRRSEALQGTDEAIRLRRELVGRDRDAHIRDLARSLNNHAITLGELGRPEDALTCSKQALGLYRELVTINRSAHLPDLGTALINFAERLIKNGDPIEGHRAAQEAADVFGRLVAQDRDAYLPRLAMSLNILAGYVARVGSAEQALAVARESVAAFRELAQRNRASNVVGLARAVNSLASRLAGVGRWDEALIMVKEGVDLRRELVGLNRNAHLSALAGSLDNLAHLLARVERRDDAATAAWETVTLYEELVVDNEESYRHSLIRAQELAERLSRQIRDV